MVQSRDSFHKTTEHTNPETNRLPGWQPFLKNIGFLGLGEIIRFTHYAFLDGLLASITHRFANNDIIDAFDYTFDEDYFLTSIDSDFAGETEYGYDEQGQVVSEDSTLATNDFTYDANGNRVGTGFVIGVGNRLLSDGVWDYSYDDEGNLVTKERAFWQKRSPRAGQAASSLNSFNHPRIHPRCELVIAFRPPA